MTTLKLNDYVNFNSLQELNHHVSLHTKHNQLNDTQFKLLTILSQYSVKYLGASYLKVSTLMSLLDVSKSTVKRNLKVLVELGIITKQHTFRKVSGGFGANIFIINEYFETTNEPSNVNPCEGSEKTAGERLEARLEKEETAFHKALKSNSLVTNQSSINREWNINYKDIIPSHIPTKLGEHMIKFFNSADVCRIYQSLKNATKFYIHRYDNEKIEDLMFKGVNALIQAIKNNNWNPEKYSKVSNIYGYAYHSTLNICVADEFDRL
ncbi:helix-turn-helix domain-containing protein [Corticicoccus populi]|uniref:Helix-turn-helix domain-containing protein n=1 Tax=Corticicoccus populi TaxID=1812821 RepID=A0ABW5WTF8_9STAP